MAEKLTFNTPFVDKKEILRYMGCKTPDDNILSLLEECLSEAIPTLSYAVSYSVYPIKYKKDISSNGLLKHLSDSDEIIIFAATIGVGIDRLISKYSRISPTKAVAFQAIGAERIEALCDAFCEEMKKKYGCITNRFSPGYSDWDIKDQKLIISVTDATKNLGICLNDSFLMSPSKSVTAVVGIKNTETEEKNSCESCDNAGCIYRREI
ncbi:MAG: hypothetical protein IJY83_07115 [Oscillospiraceae bacterium]|nr:hypothetical protein [Oscillospiraceae bacterium]